LRPGPLPALLAAAAALAALGCGGRPGIRAGGGDAAGDGGPADAAARDGATDGTRSDGPLPPSECASGGGLQIGSPWPMRGRCPSHAGQASVSGPQTAAVRWTFLADGPVTGSPVISRDGTVHIGSDDGYLHALQPDGSERWRVGLPAPVSGTPAIATDGAIFVSCEMNYMAALRADGDLIWSKGISETNSRLSPAASILIGDEGLVYLGDSDGVFHALAHDGDVQWTWTCPNGCAFYSPPAQGSDGTIYTGAGGSAHLYAFTAGGQQRWAFDVDNSIDGAPAVGDGDTVYAAAGIAHERDTLYAVRSGSLAWTAVMTESSLSTVSPSIGADGTVYAAFDDGTMRAFTAGGEAKWSYRTGSRYHTAAAIGADGTLYFGANDGRLYAVTAAGDLLWSFQTGAEIVSSPAIGADGTLYVGSRDRNVYAIGP
jgi:outer membrane protein assembly factor BamB